VPTFTPVAGKTLRSRQSYRTDLAVMLRDTGNTIWSAEALNMCLDEALGLVQAQFPPVRVYEFAPTAGEQEYALPADCVSVVGVERAYAQATDDVPLFLPVGFVVKRRYFKVGDSGTEDLTRLYLILDEEPATDYLHYVEYVAATQVWGSWSTTGSGVDTATTEDLNPASLGDGLPLRLFWAEARVAAYAYALQLPPSDGGRDFARELDRAEAARDRILDGVQRPGQVAVRHSMFG